MRSNNLAIKLILTILMIIISINIASALDADVDGYNSTIDCNDNNSMIHTNITGYIDNDNDTYTIGNAITLCTDGTLPSGYSSIQQPEDCNDNDSSAFISLNGFADMDNDTYTIGNQITLCTDGTIPSGYKSIRKQEDCNDSNADISPSIKEILYNSKDDDCNPSTHDQLELVISTDKTTYNIGETVDYVILGTPNSTIAITLASPNNYYNYNANYINQAYPILDSLSSTGKIGTYTLRGTISRDGYSRTFNASFTVRNSISANVEGKTSILINETLSLTASAAGGIAPYTYSWNLGDGNTKQGATITHKYTTPKDYDATLQITDSLGNAYTKNIDIAAKGIYLTTFVIKDKATNKPVNLVSITGPGYSLKTGTNGIASANIPEGSYDFFIYKEGYIMQTIERRIKSAETINITLVKTDDTPPKITLQNKDVESKTENITIEYSVEEESKTSCILYLNEDGSDWWTEKAKDEDIEINRIERFILQLDDQKTSYKIECIDSEGNSAFSTIGNIEIMKENEEQRAYHEGLLQQIDSIINSIDSLELNKKKIYDSFGIEENLRTAKKYLSSYAKDIFSIKNNICIGTSCDSSEEKMQQKIEAIDKRLNDSLENTIKEIQVLKIDEYIKYPSEEEISAVLKEYFDMNNKTVTDKQMKNIIQNNLMLQTRQGVFSKVIDAKIYYLDGHSHDATIIIKEISTNSTSSNQFIIERISRTYDGEIKIISKYDSVSKNHIQFNKDTKSIAYYFEEKLGDKDKEEILTMLVDPNIFVKATPTGFSVLDLKDKNTLRTIIPLTLLAIIILIRLFFMFELNKKINFLNFNKNKQLIHSTNMLVNDCLDYLDAKDFEKAVFVYKEIRLTYEKLPEKVKSEVYQPIINLVKILDEKYINILIESREIQKLKEIIPTMPADLRNKFLPAISLMNS